LSRGEHILEILTQMVVTTLVVFVVVGGVGFHFRKSVIGKIVLMIGFTGYIIYASTFIFAKIDVNPLLRYGNAVFIAILLASILIPSMKRYLIKPIEQLEGALTKLSQGDLSHRISISTGDEFSRMGTQYNVVAENLVA
jgi:methyl-accepting chemotaxis protein